MDTFSLTRKGSQNQSHRHGWGAPRKLSQGSPALHPGRTLSQDAPHREGQLSQTPRSPPRPVPPSGLRLPAQHPAAQKGEEDGARGEGGGSRRRPQGSRAATPWGQRAASPSMAGVPGAGPGSQLSPRRAKAKPFARGGNARRAPAVASLPGIRPRLRAAPPPPTRVGARSRCAALAGHGRCAVLRRGRRGRVGRPPRLFVPRPARLQSRSRGCAALLARGPGSAWRAGPRLLTLFLGDFGSCSPPRSDRRSLVMSPRPGLEQSQGCWQAAAVRRAQGEAQACCARRGR